MEVQERRDCRNCGAVLAGDARFCQRCGAPVASAALIDADDDRIDGAAGRVEPARRSVLGVDIPPTTLYWVVRVSLGVLVAVTALVVVFTVAILLFGLFVE